MTEGAVDLQIDETWSQDMALRIENLFGRHLL